MMLRFFRETHTYNFFGVCILKMITANNNFPVRYIQKKKLIFSFLFQSSRQRMNNQQIMDGLNKYADEPLDFENFEFDKFRKWSEGLVKNIFGDWDTYFEWCVMAFSSDGKIVWYKIDLDH